MSILAGFGLFFRLLGKRDRISPFLHRFRKPVWIVLAVSWGAGVAADLADDYRRVSKGDFGPIIVVLIVLVLLYRHVARVRAEVAEPRL